MQISSSQTLIELLIRVPSFLVSSEGTQHWPSQHPGPHKPNEAKENAFFGDKHIHLYHIVSQQLLGYQPFLNVSRQLVRIWRRKWHPTPVLLPGKSHRRSLVGCSPWGYQESDTTERLHFHFSLSCIGEGNCNPLQYSCLENPRDGGAQWAAIYGVTQSQTQLM